MIKNTMERIYSKIYYILFKKTHKYHILSDEETIEKIINKKVSICRFGDGEFKWIMGIKQKSFQNDNIILTSRLNEVLISNNDNILICIPYSFVNVKNYTDKTKTFWQRFIRWYGKKISKMLDLNKIYGSSTFTRWYMESKDKDNNILMKNKIENLKRIWNNRDLLIIEGNDTKIGVGNDFLDNAKSIKRIIAPSTDAFDKYDEILQATKNLPKDVLILLALGPTATVLAYDLALLGYQALDVGHIDIEYEWYIRGAKEKILIDGKYVNEAGGMLNVDSNEDLNYKKTIIKRIEV